MLEGSGLHKIGTTNDVIGRFRTLQSGSPAELRLVGVMDGTYALEKMLHEEFAVQRRHGEWFQLSEEQASDLRSRLRPVGGFDVLHGPHFPPAAVELDDDDLPLVLD